MRRFFPVFLSLLLILALSLGGWWWLRLSPRGVWNPAGPEDAMERILEEHTTEDWRSLLAPLWEGEVSEFEDREQVFSALFEAAVAGEELRFYELGEYASAREAVYLLCASSHALGAVTLRYEDGQWRWADTAAGDRLLGERYTLSLTVPEGCRPTVNGRSVGDEYLAEENIPYGDMTPLESRFAHVPTQRRYEIPGLYFDADVAAEDQTLLYADGESFRYAPPDAHSYAFRILAPQDAAVTVNGALLTTADSSGGEDLYVPVDVPEELRGYLPAYLLYEFSGLYSVPEITVTSHDGRLLEGTERGDGTVCYTDAAGEVPEDLASMAGKYMRTACLFGVSRATYEAFFPYLTGSSDLRSYYLMAQSSLSWIRGAGLDIRNVWCDSYLPLGEEACLLTVHCQCATSNYFTRYDLDLAYRLLCVRTAEGWRIQDMAYE